MLIWMMFLASTSLVRKYQFIYYTDVGTDVNNYIINSLKGMFPSMTGYASSSYDKYFHPIFNGC